ncbi:MAG: GPMC system MBL fold metallohydrolase [Desulfuromonadales bacterium]|nr:GPMC system MBL fold metallohydrolase [Desulfuromonadales bacterium]
MKITILGSGTSTGVPMVGCRCRVCSSDDPKDKRTRASLLICHNGRNILIDASTDLRFQALREDIERIDAVLFTHSHADHVNGIDDLRGFHFLHKEIIPCFGSRATLETLEAGFGYIFHEHDGSGYTPLLQPIEVDGSFELFGLTITPVPLEHGRTRSLGYRIDNFAYLTDCSSIPEPSPALLKGLDVLVIDGLRWTPHPFHFNIESAIAVTQPLKPARTVLTHLSHDVLFADGARLPPGCEFAWDGMTFDIRTT